MSSRVPAAAPQRRAPDSRAPPRGRPQAHPLPDGAVPVFPAVPLREPEEGPQDGGHEVTWARGRRSSVYARPTLHGFSAGTDCRGATGAPQGMDSPVSSLLDCHLLKSQDGTLSISGPQSQVQSLT